MITLSIRQPWAWLIVNGHKPVENRDWPTTYRGQILIHAGKARVRKHHVEALAGLAQAGIQVDVPAFDALDRGGIVGVATITDCVEQHPSPYFTGPFGFVLADARPLPFHPCNGQLKFFDVRDVPGAPRPQNFMFTSGRADFLPLDSSNRRFYAIKP